MKGGKPHYRVYMLLVKQSGGCMELTDPVICGGRGSCFDRAGKYAAESAREKRLAPEGKAAVLIARKNATRKEN